MPTHLSLDTPFARLYAVTGCTTQQELAAFLGITQASISEAKKRGTIPSTWLVTLIKKCGVSPEWILSGEGKQGITAAKKLTTLELLHRLENGIISDMLRHVPSNLLHAELCRRGDEKERNS